MAWRGHNAKQAAAGGQAGVRGNAIVCSHSARILSILLRMARRKEMAAAEMAGTNFGSTWSCGKNASSASSEHFHRNGAICVIVS
eukprot:COSAG01_NODE_3567_length_5925_cov_14.275318_5_plen_85_part_00